MLEEEEEDEYDRAEKFAKTDAYRQRCIMFSEAMMNVDLDLSSFVSFSVFPPATEDGENSYPLEIKEEFQDEEGKIAAEILFDEEATPVFEYGSPEKSSNTYRRSMDSIGIPLYQDILLSEPRVMCYS